MDDFEIIELEIDVPQLKKNNFKIENLNRKINNLSEKINFIKLKNSKIIKENLELKFKNKKLEKKFQVLDNKIKYIEMHNGLYQKQYEEEDTQKYISEMYCFNCNASYCTCNDKFKFD